MEVLCRPLDRWRSVSPTPQAFCGPCSSLAAHASFRVHVLPSLCMGRHPGDNGMDYSVNDYRCGKHARSLSTVQVLPPPHLPSTYLAYPVRSQV